MVCDFEFSFEFVLSSESTEPRNSLIITAVPQHALNCIAQVFLTSPLAVFRWSREIVSAFVEPRSIVKSRPPTDRAENSNF